MATSNAVYFPVSEVPALENVGWMVTVANYTDFSTHVADLNDYISLSVSPELSDVGQGSITLSLTSPFWDTTLGNGLPASDLLEKEYLFQCWEDGILRFEFIGDKQKENRIESDEAQSVTISGPGTGHLLTWAEVYPKGYPNVKPSDLGSLISYDWDFKKKSAMPLFIQLLKASQGRKVIPYFSYTFTNTLDSGKVAWADNKKPLISYEVNFGTNLLDMLNIFTGQDTSTNAGVRADWYVRPRFKLDVRQTFGVHREGEVIFFEGDVMQKTRDRDRSAIRNYVVIRDSTGAISSSYNASSIARWQKREHIEQRDGLWDVPRRSGVTNVLQQQLSAEDSSWTVGIPYNRPGRRPFRDFDIGDWVGVSTPQEGGWNKVEAYRVMGITIQVEDDDTQVELTLESVWKSNQRRLAIRIQQIINTPPKGTVKLPATTPTSSIPVVYDPSQGLIADPNYSFGGGYGSLWVQPQDPYLNATTKAEVNTGDFWIQTNEAAGTTQDTSPPEES